MMQNKSILALYEDFLLHPGELSGGDGFFDYRTPESLHSDITSFAYGLAEVQSCVSLENHPCISTVSLDASQLSRRFYIKLKACLFRYQAYICPITIRVNGRIAYEDPRAFFETVNLGWPTVYIPVANDFLQAGDNIIEVSQGEWETALLVSKVDLLSLPEIKPYAQLSYCPSVRQNTEFALAFYTPNGAVAVQSATDCRVLSVAPSPLFPDHTLVRLVATGKNPQMTLSANGKALPVQMPVAYPYDEDICLIGTDSDDHRHDDSDEANRIISIFSNSHLGNFFQARPQIERNYHDLSSLEVWKNRVAHLQAYGAKLSLADSSDRMPFFPEMVGKEFVGKHFHEAYLYFCSALERDAQMSSELFLDVKKMKASESFGESRKMFCEALQKMYANSKTEHGHTSVGSPSLLVSYEASSGFERVTIEPVSNIALLIAAVRGAKPEIWGAHVPTDWYFGEPNNRTKAKKFLLAMQMLYLAGAQYIYAENSLFKTNAFSREDWEDDFCTDCRTFQRSFYDYTLRKPRKGSLQNQLAVIYGNNEFILWHHDDRIAELGENGDWDIKLWGKWENSEHQKCWRAVDAWLPLADNQNAKKNVLNLNLFSGTPYGAVDIVPYAHDYNAYRSVVLLGWNTYEDGFASKIYDYVSQGGTAFLSYCHFNRTDRCDLPMVYANSAEVQKLLGNFDEKIVDTGTYSILTSPIEGAQPLFTDAQDNVLVWEKSIGKGKLYFGTFADYRCPDEKKAVLMQTLTHIGNATADIRCDNPNLYITVRKQADGYRIVDVLNVCANSETPESFTITFADGKKLSGIATPCEIQSYLL